MTWFGTATVLVFIAALCVGVGAWFYAARYFLLWWSARSLGVERPVVHLNKVANGVGVFVAACVVAGAAFLVGFLGGGWT